MHPALAGLFEIRPSAEVSTVIPHAFTSVGSAALKALNHGRIPDQAFLEAYLDCLRCLRRASFDNWIRLASESPLIINLPSTTKAQSGRVVEAMAAGCPVLTWELPERPRANALFRDGEELLLFPRDNPAVLAEKIQYLANNPEIALKIADNALEKVRDCHTVEIRVGQILQWIETGCEPNYQDGAAGSSATCKLTSPVGENTLDELLSRFFEMSRYHGYQSRYHLEQESDPLNISDSTATLAQIEAALERKDVAVARSLLESAYTHIPGLTPYLAQFYFVTGEWDKAEEFLLQALSGNPNDAEINLKLAQLARLAGNEKTAAIYMEQALALGPPAGEVLNLLKEHRRARGEK